MPTFDSLMNPLLNALFDLGGSGSVNEIYEKVLELEAIDEKISSIPHSPEKSNQTEIAYRLAWARTFLKKYGFLENSSRGVWTLTKLAKEGKKVIPKDVIKTVNKSDECKKTNELEPIEKIYRKKIKLGKKKFIPFSQKR